MLDTERGEIVQDSGAQGRTRISSRRPYGQWLRRQHDGAGGLCPEPASVHGFGLRHPGAKAGRVWIHAGRPANHPRAYGPHRRRSLSDRWARTSRWRSCPSKSPVLFHYFRQRFAQVSNPPLDSIREELVTSTRAMIGRELEPVRRNSRTLPTANCQRAVHHKLLTSRRYREIDVNGISIEDAFYAVRPREERGGLEEGNGPAARRRRLRPSRRDTQFSSSPTAEWTPRTTRLSPACLQPPVFTIT